MKKVRYVELTATLEVISLCYHALNSGFQIFGVRLVHVICNTVQRPPGFVQHFQPTVIVLTMHKCGSAKCDLALQKAEVMLASKSTGKGEATPAKFGRVVALGTLVRKDANNNVCNTE